jgi:hypothetical protein
MRGDLEQDLIRKFLQMAPAVFYSIVFLPDRWRVLIPQCFFAYRYDKCSARIVRRRGDFTTYRVALLLVWRCMAIRWIL